MLCANPASTTQLKLREEHSQIIEQLQESDIEPTASFAINKTDLMREAMETKPQILHFSGHGAGKGLMLQNDLKSGSDLLTAEQASALFGFLTKSLPLQAVILNACHSIEQAEAISHHIPYVVGTTVAIADQHAIAFSIGFYMQLSMQKDIALAYEAGKTRAILEGAQSDNFELLIRA
jgi:hypothetical protein